jgi:hypothetical protein
MIALVLAPLIAVVPPPPAPACGPTPTTPTAQHAPVRAQKLGDLPDAEMDLAVIRSVDGCAVREVVRLHVSEGATAVLPTPGFTGKLVFDGAAARTTRAGR